jgi:hypothetical protein
VGSKNQWWLISIFAAIVGFLAIRAPDGELSVDVKSSTTHSEKRIDGASVQSQIPELKARDFDFSALNDLFKSKSWFVPPPPPKPAPPPPPKVEYPQPPTAPPLPYTYLGSYQEPGGKLAIYLTRLGKVYLVSSGDTLENLYHIDDIQDGYLGMTYLPLNIKQTLRIGVN